MNLAARVLLVDDEQPNLDAYSEELHALNPSWEIHCATSEPQAFELLSQLAGDGRSIDLLITDLVMDTEDRGLQILEKARILNPFLMVIIFTAKDSTFDRMSAFEKGAYDVIEKRRLGGAAISELNIKANAALRFKERATTLLSLRRYFDPYLSNILERSPERLNLQNRLVTVVFWDIRGFSKLSEILVERPALVAEFLQEYFDAAAQIIQKHGGILDKFIGDGVMALFGALEDSADDGVAQAQAAVSAAQDLRTAFLSIEANWNSRWARVVAQLIEIGLGCGMHTGNALVGRVGTSLRDQFTAFGRVVNLAARIESKSKHNEILLSKPTMSRVRDVFRIEQGETVNDIKGIPGDFPTYRVL